MNEKVYPKGRFILEVIDKETNKVLEKREADNLIVNNGRIAIAKQMNGEHPAIGTSGKSSIQIGKNGTAPTVNDTSLNDLYRDEVCDMNWNDTEKRWEITHTFSDFTETVNICEAGFWSYYASYDNVLFDRVTFSSLELTPTKNLKVTIYITP